MAPKKQTVASLWKAFMAGPFDTFIECCDVDSIKNLRLTSRTVNDRCLTPRFRKCFEKIVTTLDPERLDSLLSLLKDNHILGIQSIKRLTIMATVYDFAPLHLAIATNHWHTIYKHGTALDIAESKLTPEMIDMIRNGLTWMHAKKLMDDKHDAQPIINTLAYILRILGGLEELSLDVLCIKGPGILVPGGRAAEWAPVWDSAMETYRRTVEAMAKSQIPIEHFDVYSKPVRCSIESMEVTKHIDRDELFEMNFAKGVASKFKKFSLSFSPKTKINSLELQLLQRTQDGRKTPGLYSPLSPVKWQYQGSEPEFNHPDNHRGIAEMLNHMVVLEELDLHQYQVSSSDVIRNDQVFRQISQISLPKLRKITLRGIRTDQQDLMRFLIKHRNLTQIAFHNFHLTSGTWERIFHFLAHDMPDLRHLSLGELKDPANGFVNITPTCLSGVMSDAFNKVADLKFLRKVAFQAFTGAWAWHTRVIDEDEIEEGIDLPFHSQAIFPTSNVKNFWDAHHDEYGPD